MAFQDRHSARDAIAALVILGCDKVCAFVSRALFGETQMKSVAVEVAKSGMEIVIRGAAFARITEAAKAVGLSREEFIEAALESTVKSAIEGAK